MSIKSIKIDEIDLYNFMTFDKFNINKLSQYKIIFICGHNAQGKSTITSEAPYFTFFNKPLRYGKIEELINWNYDHKKEEEAYAKLSLSVLNDNNEESFLTVKRNIVGSRYEFEVSDNDHNLYDELYIAKNIPSFNNSLKKILDINESVFSILYLKSPFSQVIFDSNSELLSKITKSEYINELRKDFKSIESDLRINIKNLRASIEKQNELSESIKNQLNEILNEDDYKDNLKKIEKISLEISKVEKMLNDMVSKYNVDKTKYDNFINKKNQLQLLINKTNFYIDQLKKEKEEMLNLVKQGKCFTCKQDIEKDLYNIEIHNIDNKIKKYSDILNKSYDNFNKLNIIIDDINKKIISNQSNKEMLNDKIRSLSNLRATLKESIKNHDKNKKNNHDILVKIRRTIIDLNDELSQIDSDYKIISSISKLLLAKNSEYINEFYNKKIYNFNIIFKSILSKLTNNKFYDVKILLNNKPILNENIQYKALSTSEKKFIDISFVIAYIIYLSSNLKFKTFILDEFFDNYDKDNIIHIYNTIYSIADEYGLQLFITTNKSDYLFNEIDRKSDIKILEL
jgi:DNA repair exonuclease SbcCD ATPase subunit